MSSGPAFGARNDTVDALRGFAAVAVCFFHFTLGTSHFVDVSILRGVGSYGWLGVEVFFVISGFIVPYAMTNARYSLDQWPRFVAKRLIRLEPPYLVSIAVVIVLSLASSIATGFRRPAVDVTLSQLADHFGYLNGYLGLPWLNSVYWSLAIEFHYVLIGITLPALIAGTPLTRLLIVAALAAMPLLGSHQRRLARHRVSTDLRGRLVDVPTVSRPHRRTFVLAGALCARLVSAHQSGNRDDAGCDPSHTRYCFGSLAAHPPGCMAGRRLVLPLSPSCTHRRTRHKSINTPPSKRGDCGCSSRCGIRGLAHWRVHSLHTCRAPNAGDGRERFVWQALVHDQRPNEDAIPAPPT
jgi:hypothetical protein